MIVKLISLANGRVVMIISVSLSSNKSYCTRVVKIHRMYKAIMRVNEACIEEKGSTRRIALRNAFYLSPPIGV